MLEANPSVHMSMHFCSVVKACSIGMKPWESNRSSSKENIAWRMRCGRYRNLGASPDCKDGGSRLA